MELPIYTVGLHAYEDDSLLDNARSAFNPLRANFYDLRDPQQLQTPLIEQLTNSSNSHPRYGYAVIANTPTSPRGNIKPHEHIGLTRLSPREVMICHINQLGKARMLGRVANNRELGQVIADELHPHFLAASHNFNTHLRKAA